MAEALASSLSSLWLQPSPCCSRLASRNSLHSGLRIPNKLPSTSFKLVVPPISASSSSSLADPDSIEAFVKASMPGGIAAQKILGTGSRKTAVARVCLLEGTGRIIINCRTAQDYLQGNPLWLQYVKYPLTSLGYETKYDVIVKAEGGGLSAQAQAILLGIARALLVVNPANRDPLKKQGLLTRDSRSVERKKAGLHKARKAPQYSKR